MAQYSNRVILCGAAQGLGYAIAQYFHQKGWETHIFDAVYKENREVEGIFLHSCDATHFESVKKAVAEVMEKGDVDALINSIRYRRPKEEKPCPIFEWKQNLDIGLTTYYNTSLAVCEAMKQKGTGCSLINLSSILSEVVAIHESVGYHAAKGAINQLTRYLAVQYGPFKIRANSILPGLISRDRPEYSSEDPHASFYAKQANHIPLRRSGGPQEVAELAYFLASPTSSFITGQNIVIDGGLSLRDQIGLIS